MIHTVMYNDFKFEIDDDGVLCSMSNPSKHSRAYIPKILPTGEEIKKLGKKFLEGKYKEVNISDEIVEIESEAFADAKVKSVIWSAGCKTIPEYCFSGSEIKTIKNIEKVETIGKYAFAKCNINNLDLSSIAITSIGKGAFVGIDREKIIFPYYTDEEVLEDFFKS